MQALREPGSSSVLVPLRPQSTVDVLLSATGVHTVISVSCYFLHVACQPPHSVLSLFPWDVQIGQKQQQKTNKFMIICSSASAHTQQQREERRRAFGIYISISSCDCLNGNTVMKAELGS